MRQSALLSFVDDVELGKSQSRSHIGKTWEAQVGSAYDNDNDNSNNTKRWPTARALDGRERHSSSKDYEKKASKIHEVFTNSAVECHPTHFPHIISSHLIRKKQINQATIPRNTMNQCSLFLFRAFLSSPYFRDDR